VLRITNSQALDCVEAVPERRKVSLAKLERDYIVETLGETNWKITGKNGAAAILDLNPSTLRGRIRKYGIQRPQKDNTRSIQLTPPARWVFRCIFVEYDMLGKDEAFRSDFWLKIITRIYRLINKL